MSIFGTDKDCLLLQGRLKAAEDDLRTLQSAVRALELEWIETYDKVSRQMSRMAKRYAVDNPKIEEPEELETVGKDGTRLDSISAGIIRRRAGHGGKQ